MLPNALVTGAPDRVPDIAIALKSAGFDILAAGDLTADDAPDLEPRSVDCYVQLPVDAPGPAGRPVDSTRAVIAREVLSRFDSAARFLPLLAPSATVLLVTDGPAAGAPRGGAGDPGRTALRSLVGVLAETIVRDGRPTGVRATVVDDDPTPDAIAALAARRPPEPLPWWRYAGVDPDLCFADWRNSVFCLGSLNGA